MSSDNCPKDVSCVALSSDGSGTFGSSSGDNSSYNKPLPPTPVIKKDKGKRAKFNSGTTSGSMQGEPSLVIHVNINRTKHPPPKMPPCSKNLNSSQEKMRHILQSLITTEESYVTSLEKLNDNYHNVIVGSRIGRQDFVKRAFQKVGDIYNYHNMCQIDLSDKIRDWHTKESIGDFFIAFSKEVIVEAYSTYVNCYSATMEVLRTKSGNRNNMKGLNKMDIEVSMLKPVQRFPQYIMIVKDLLKYTPKDHTDRENLQEALTHLENVAHLLNERKRMSEQMVHGQHIMKKLDLKAFRGIQVYQLRQDDVMQLEEDGCRGPASLILLNQLLICTAPRKRGSDGRVIDQGTLKWYVELQHLELKDSAPSKHSIIEENLDEDFCNLDADLYEMKFDYNVLTQIAAPIRSLKRSYPTISEDKLQETLHDLQKMILQSISSRSIVLYDNSSKTCHERPPLLPAKSGLSRQVVSHNRNMTYVFQTLSPKVKLEWCVDFLLAKYALDPMNQPSWDKQQVDDTDEVSLNSMPAYLIKHMSVDEPQHLTRVSVSQELPPKPSPQLPPRKSVQHCSSSTDHEGWIRTVVEGLLAHNQIKCTVPVFLPTHVNEEIGLQHLWVCSSTEDLGRVSIISIHSANPCLMEFFPVTNCEIVCAEMVPGFALVQSEWAFAEDTVWMSTVVAEIIVFTVVNTTKSQGRLSQRTAAYVFKMKGVVLMMQYVDDRLFAGMGDGGLTIFSRNDEGIWNQFQAISLGQSPVVAMTNVGTETWVVCDSRIHVFEADSKERKTVLSLQLDADSSESTEVIRFIVKVGVGLWVSYEGRPLIRLFHLESRKHLQDVNITKSVSKLFTEYYGTTITASPAQHHFEVTSLETSLGLLWVGTNVGIILAYPLPRLQDGVPRINVRPSVALHGHQCNVRFIIPMLFGAVAKSSGIDKDEQYNTGLSGDISVSAHGESEESRSLKTQNQSQQQDQEQGTNVISQDERSCFFLPHASKQGRRPDQIQDPKSEDQAERPDSVSNRAKARISNHAKSGDFTAELEQKLARRRAWELPNSTLVYSGEDEIKVLYGNLLESGSTATTQSHMEKKSSILPIDSTAEQCDRTLDESMSRKDNPTSRFNLRRMTYTAPGGNKVSGSVQQHKSWTLPQADNKNSRTHVGTSVQSGSTLDTLRKQNTTAFIVLSGGDGYIDWKGRQPSQYRPDEACLLVWLYRF